MTDACVPRSRSNLLAKVAEVNPLAAKYSKRDVTGDGQPETFCNVFCLDVCIALGVCIPAKLASEQIAWLDSDNGREWGWIECSSVEASVAAELGQPCLAGWLNPAGHSHIAVCVPANGGSTPYIAQAGARNFLSEPVSHGFGSHPVKYWRHP